MSISIDEGRLLRSANAHFRARSDREKSERCIHDMYVTIPSLMKINHFECIPYEKDHALFSIFYQISDCMYVQCRSLIEARKQLSLQALNQIHLAFKYQPLNKDIQLFICKILMDQDEA